MQGSAMTEAILDIKPWGNNLGVRLPASVAKRANVAPNSPQPTIR